MLFSGWAKSSPWFESLQLHCIRAIFIIDCMALGYTKPTDYNWVSLSIPYWEQQSAPYSFNVALIAINITQSQLFCEFYSLHLL